MIPALPFSPDLTARLSGSPLVVLLDIDGTLAPIAPRPEQAFVPPETCAAVTALTRLVDVHVAVVTGRSVNDANRLVGLPDVGVIGNHGFEVLGEHGELLSEPAAHSWLEPMRTAASRLSEVAGHIHGVVIEDKKWTLSLHYRLAERSVIPQLTEAVNTIGRELGLAVTRGKEALELRPPMPIDKGTASVLFVRNAGAGASGSVLYIGDDRTDEDAFRALRAEFSGAVTVRVGDPDHREETSAEFRVETPAEVRKFLEALIELRSD